MNEEQLVKFLREHLKVRLDVDRGRLEVEILLVGDEPVTIDKTNLMLWDLRSAMEELRE